MPRRIKTVVSPNGDIATQFDGFAGESCKLEEARFRKELTLLGLKSNPMAFRPVSTIATPIVGERGKSVLS